MKLRKIVLTVTLFQMFLFSVMLGGVMALRQDITTGDLVGVKVGDWVKFSVVKLGEPGIWIPPFERTVVWIKVEVQNFSGTAVTYRETVYSTDRGEEARSFSVNLEETAQHGYWYYIIAANLSEGDHVGAGLRALNGTNYDWVDLSVLSINKTVSRSYGAVSREVNILEWSYLLPVFEYIYNCSQEYYWDRETGFLLERTWQQYALGYWRNATWSPLQKNATWSELQLKIVDTNIWKMETTQPVRGQWMLLAATGGIAVAVVATTFLMRAREKNKEKRSELHRK